MSQWANENPEKMAEIAALPPSQQNEALRDAIGYDPDRIRDEQKERRGLGSGVFIDGTRITPGSEKCKCGAECEFPCWQRLGIAPACSACGCPPLPSEDEDA